ncbi:hypothetical protein CELD12_26470 [Cellulomonas sp. NTE-D12]|nr:hypothetical protein CELD12_26470 [Cellulomonas sp. NTE-D12]
MGVTHEPQDVEPAPSRTTLTATRDAFVEAVETDNREAIRALAGRLWSCTDIMPGYLCVALDMRGAAPTPSPLEGSARRGEQRPAPLDRPPSGAGRGSTLGPVDQAPNRDGGPDPALALGASARAKTGVGRGQTPIASGGPEYHFLPKDPEEALKALRGPASRLAEPSPGHSPEAQEGPRRSTGESEQP